MDDHVVKCPACLDGDLQVLSDQIVIPHFGDVLISTLLCPRCGYRSSDIVPLEKLPPRRYVLQIDGPQQMKIRIIRSGSSTVKIPEIGARIDPGLFSEGYVTNVEGILQRFQDILYQLLRDFTSSYDEPDSEEKIKRTRDLIDRLDAFKNDTELEQDKITLIIEDPYGNSAILGEEGDNIKEEALTDDEIIQMLDLKNEKNDISDL